MHIVIINASPYGNKYSQTSQIVQAFMQGIRDERNTFEFYSLCYRSQWKDIIDAILNNENFVFVLPVYLGITPSVFKEFLEKVDSMLPKETRGNKKIAFILQSAFPEASQRRCCEKYLESFVKHLKCQFSGILSHSVYYGLADSTNSGNLMDEYSFFGREYIKSNATFFFSKAEEFNGEEYLTEKQAKKFVRGFNFMSKLNAEEQGITGDLYSNPYNKK